MSRSAGRIPLCRSCADAATVNPHIAGLCFPYTTRAGAPSCMRSENVNLITWCDRTNDGQHFGQPDGNELPAWQAACSRISRRKARLRPRGHPDGNIARSPAGRRGCQAAVRVYNKLFKAATGWEPADADKWGRSTTRTQPTCLSSVECNPRGIDDNIRRARGASRPTATRSRSRTSCPRVRKNRATRGARAGANPASPAGLLRPPPR